MGMSGMNIPSQDSSTSLFFLLDIFPVRNNIFYFACAKATSGEKLDVDINKHDIGNKKATDQYAGLYNNLYYLSFA